MAEEFIINQLKIAFSDHSINIKRTAIANLNGYFNDDVDKQHMFSIQDTEKEMLPQWFHSAVSALILLNFPPEEKGLWIDIAVDAGLSSRTEQIAKDVVLSHVRGNEVLKMIF